MKISYAASDNMSGNVLTAPELLTNKGIRFETWKKWDKTVEMLPCTGQKQYEPNNSWLQNKQIEKGLEDHMNLIGVERVNRSSQLASAEWLPQESRARVTKKSGQEWTSFGTEENLELYLIPEEALLLLELNCLQLTWHGVALSIQQAYRVLIGSDASECNIEEYRVYSHLVRQGYRLQRFRRTDSFTMHNGSIRFQRSSSLKRQKQIQDSLNSFETTVDHIQADVGGKAIKDQSASTTEDPDELQWNQENSNPENLECVRMCGRWTKSSNMIEPDSQTRAHMPCTSDTTVSSSVGVTRGGCSAAHEPEGCMSDIETRFLPEEEKSASVNVRGVKKLQSEPYDNGVVNLPGPSNVEVKKTARNNRKDSKLQIISDETLLGDFKMISKWPGTRIQRNVEWVPKRTTDETIPATLKTINDGCISTDTNVNEWSSLVVGSRSRINGEPSLLSTAMDIESAIARKRQRTQEEIIEVSDDEIEELPQKLSRMEMLNLFPNIVSESLVTKRISRRYLPRNVWPQKISNQFTTKWNLPVVEEHCKSSSVYEHSRVSRGAMPNYTANSRSRIPPMRSGNTNEHSHKHISINASFRGSGPRLGNDAAAHLLHKNIVSSNGSGPHAYRNESLLGFGNENSRQGSCYYRGAFECRTMGRQYYDQTAPRTTQSYKTTFGGQNHFLVQSGFYSNVTVSQNIRGKSEFRRRGLVGRQNMWTNMSYYSSKQNLVHFPPRPNVSGQRPIDNRNRKSDTPRYSGESSFILVPKAPSWLETKAKWSDERTITIEDEDCGNDNDSMVEESEVKVVARPVKPLVDERNATSLAQAYKSLQIIKRATTKHVEHSISKRKIDNYRIFYNLYPTARHFKKSNPGCPLYRIVILRSEDTPCIELAEIERLKKDANGTPIILACASHTTITFAELDTVQLPDVWDNYCERQPI